jgi:hypothetical protein
MGAAWLRFDAVGFAAKPRFWGAPENLTFSLWLVNFQEVGDTIWGFYHPIMLSAKMGARGGDGLCR